ncbi:hypothetical protein F4859DRAFT_518624 [Xylaria cf. heliscus]|nr:hypothetical protein F4859DRAFT_518624 [Xylaria cf. heliscus]
MEYVPVGLFPQSEQDKHLDVSYKERWEHLKPVIVALYLGKYDQEGKTTTLSQVVEFMKVNYSFHAAAGEYRTHLKNWSISKRVVKDVKDSVVVALAKRKRPGTSTSHVTVVGGGHKKQLHPNKLIRHLKEQRRHSPVEVVTPGLISIWNLPYEAFITSIHKEVDRPSPFGPRDTTPDHVEIGSPKPLVLGRGVAGSSPNMQLVYQKARENRATLFLQGRLEELIVTMCREDRKLLVNYFHDIYIYNFTKAKEWGSQSLSVKNGFAPFLVSQRSNISGGPITPSFRVDSPTVPTILGPPNRPNISGPPTQLCHWAIHVPKYDAKYTLLHDPPKEQPPSALFTDELRQSIVRSSFNDTPEEDLPIAQDSIVRAIENNLNALEINAWKFAIMAGNRKLINKMWAENGWRVPEGLDKIYPLHLAAAFLDGGHICCKVLEQLIYCLKPTYAFYHNIDGHGHTILDALMVSILRSHTTISPDSVSHRFRSPRRFPGEEMDICGRWTSDTPHVRELFHQGYSQIPSSWKHPFCHTAVQAICHCITAIYGPACGPAINTTSGLFTRRCTECGLALWLGPLHTLVVTTFHLANSGRPGETLFGAMAVLVCLLTLGADASLTANISAEEILRTCDGRDCSHTHLSPLELMRRVPENVIDGWSSECKVGWNCFAQILSRAERIKGPPSRPDPNSDPMNRSGADVSSGEHVCPLEAMTNASHHDSMNPKCHGAKIGLIWAMAQAEFLTYRRIKEGDAWVSERFSMRALNDWLVGNTATLRMPFATEKLMGEHTRCGWFLEGGYVVIYLGAENVSARGFMNLDICERATYIDVPDLDGMWFDGEYSDGK